MPTTNPVPSTDPTDLLFNAGKLDEVVNGTANSFTDRFGATRRTLAGLDAEFPNAAANAAAAAAAATDASEAAQIALDEAAAAATHASAADASRAAAEAARDAANAIGMVFTTTALGIAGTVSGQSFSVLSADSNYLIVYTNSAGTAVEVTRYVTKDGLAPTENLQPSMADVVNAVTPPSVQTYARGRVDGTPSGALTGIWISILAANEAPIKGYLTSLSVKHSTALAGRKCEWYSLRPSGGSYTVIWASGEYDTSASGVNTVDLTPTALGYMLPGDVIGVRCSAAANSDGVSFTYVPTGTDSILRLSNAQPRLSVGEVITGGVGGYVAATDIQVQLAYTLKSTALFVTTDQSGAPFGYPRLQADARVSGSNLPAFSGDVLSVSDSSGATETAGYVFRPAASLETYSVSKLNTATEASYPTTFTNSVISWDTTAPGFPMGGYLTEISIAAGGRISSGTKTIQFWVVRPTSALPTGLSGSVTVDIVAEVGTFDLTPLAPSESLPELIFKGLFIAVKAGDMLAWMGPSGFGSAVGSSGTEYSTSRTALLSGAPSSGSSFTLDTLARRALHTATIVNAPFLTSADGPVSVVRTDSLGNVPLSVSRAPDLPLKNKKIAFTGSSISTISGGGNSSDTGHLVLAANKLQCIASNLAIGGSFVQWKSASASGAGAEQYTIGATAAELTARFGASFAQYSYENKLIGQGFDGIVLPDAINDTNIGGTFTVGAWGDSAPDTYYGVMTRLIEALLTDNKDMLIWLQTPFHRWANYAGGGVYPTEQANRLAYQAAAYDLTARYGLRPVIDYIGHVQCNRIVVKNGHGLYDSIHPTQAMKDSAGQYVYSVMNAG